MKYVYYCKDCDYVGSMEGGDASVNCPKCGKRLLPTGLDREVWVAAASEEKAAYKKQWATASETIRSMPDSDAASDGNSGSNGVATLIRAIAILTYIGAFILGIGLGRDLRGDFSFFAALLYWGVGFVSGSMLLGFAEIIQLLQDIKNK